MNISKIALYNNSDENFTRTPKETIINMFEHTDENGTLYIPLWHYSALHLEKEDYFYKCAMNWSHSDLEKIISKFDYLYAAIKEIAENIDCAPENLSADLADVYETYLRDFYDEEIDYDLEMDISWRVETIHYLKVIEEKIKSGKEVSSEEMRLYNELKFTFVSKEEEAVLYTYKNETNVNAKRRIGNKIAAYDVVKRSIRLRNLMFHNTPEIFINDEANLLAQAMVINAYCNEIKIVADVE